MDVLKKKGEGRGRGSMTNIRLIDIRLIFCKMISIIMTPVII